MRSVRNDKQLILVLTLGIILLSGEVSAQVQDPQAKAMQLNQQAMAAYADYQIPMAMQLLKQAVGICTHYNLGGKMLAKIYISMGIVEAGGNQNNAAAIQSFINAVCMDITIVLSPPHSTSEIGALFNMARIQALAPGACGVQQPRNTQPQPRRASQIWHQPVTQQARHVPIPIYIQVNPNVQVGHAFLFYRSRGETTYQRIPMMTHHKGYAATIGCDVLQTLDPTGVEYYIAVVDPSNQFVGAVGRVEQPLQIVVVQSLTTTPPSLPNEAPPGKCGDGDSEGKDFGQIFRLGFAFGTGSGLVLSERTNPYNQTSTTPDHVLLRHKDNPATYDTGEISIPMTFAWGKLHFRVTAMFYLTPRVLFGIGFRGGLTMDSSPGVMPLAPTVLANVAFRMVGEGSDMFELDALLGLGKGVVQHRMPYKDCHARIFYDPTLPDEGYEEYKDTSHPWYNPYRSDEVQIGCQKSAINSTTEAWDRSNDKVDKVYFRQAKSFAIEVGIEGYVWFGNSFGISFGIVTDTYIPQFSLNLDIQLGMAFRF